MLYAEYSSNTSKSHEKKDRTMKKLLALIVLAGIVSSTYAKDIPHTVTNTLPDPVEIRYSYQGKPKTIKLEPGATQSFTMQCELDRYTIVALSGKYAPSAKHSSSCGTTNVTSSIIAPDVWGSKMLGTKIDWSKTK